MNSKLCTERCLTSSGPLKTFKFRKCLAVAQWIELRYDSAAGCGFESRQPDHTLEALGISHPGFLCFSVKLCGKAKTPPLLTGFSAIALGGALD